MAAEEKTDHELLLILVEKVDELSKDLATHIQRDFLSKLTLLTVFLTFMGGIILYLIKGA